MLDVDVDVIMEDLDDVAGFLHEQRALGAARWAKSFGQPSLMLLNHELVRAAFFDEATLPAAEFYANTVTDVMGNNIQTMRGEAHRVNRALISPAFRPSVVTDLVEPLLTPVADELIDAFIDRGHADLVAEYTRRYPFMVITRLLGLPPGDEDQVRTWALALLDIQNNYEFAKQCSADFRAYAQPMIDRRRTDPEGDLISTLATTEVEGQRLSDDEIFSFLLLLFPAGADTTYLGLGNALYHLLRDDEQMAILRSDPAEHAAWAAEEAIRLDPPVAWILRIAPTDLDWRGISIPAHTPILLGLMAANRDPAVFPDPDRFDITRRPTGVMTFGYGVHFCPGAALARAEMATSLRILLDRLPNLRLADDAQGVRITGTIHHLLRGPNRLPVTFDAA